MKPSEYNRRLQANRLKTESPKQRQARLAKSNAVETIVLPSLTEVANGVFPQTAPPVRYEAFNLENLYNRQSIFQSFFGRGAALKITSTPNFEETMPVAPKPVVGIAATENCGVRHLSGISYVGATPLEVLAQLWREHKETIRKPAHIIFTDNDVRKNVDEYGGAAYAKFLKANEPLGALIETKYAYNPNSAHDVIVWVWTPNWKEIQTFHAKGKV